MTFLTSIVIFALGCVVGIKITSLLVSAQNVNKILEKNIFPFFVIEEEQGQFYLHNKEDQSFLGQAESLEELAKLLVVRKIKIAFAFFPKNSNTKTMWFIDGKVKPARINKKEK